MTHWFEEEKECKTCKKKKSLLEFNRVKQKSGYGFTAVCKACRKENPSKSVKEKQVLSGSFDKKWGRGF